jgi:redox-sensitive bicupin YhaK (pirin superfamily)
MKRRQFIRGSAIVGATIAGGTVLVSKSGVLSTQGSRKIYRILNADRTKVGTLPILRAFAGDQQDYVSPYVLFDEFGPVDLSPGSAPLRVNAHPHAGVIPTTYFLAGSGHHKDSLNYEIQVGKDEFMMFSSGRGAIHMEETGQMLYDDGGKYHGFQIWLNMPSVHKFIAPSTWVFKRELGKIEKKDYTATVVLGELFGTKSKIDLLSPAFYYHLKLNPGCRIDIPTDPTHNAFVYAIGGSVELAQQKTLKTNQIALYERGDSLLNLYAASGAELLILGGAPLNEPVYSYGPFVMNTEEQIRKCVDDYRNGRMGDPDQVN